MGQFSSVQFSSVQFKPTQLRSHQLRSTQLMIEYHRYDSGIDNGMTMSRIFLCRISYHLNHNETKMRRIREEEYCHVGTLDC